MMMLLPGYIVTFRFVSPSLPFLFNWSKGRVPSCLKRSLVTPVPKCAQLLTMSDFPISLLPTLPKVLEKFIAPYERRSVPIVLSLCYIIVFSVFSTPLELFVFYSGHVTRAMTPKDALNTSLGLATGRCFNFCGFGDDASEVSTLGLSDIRLQLPLSDQMVALVRFSSWSPILHVSGVPQVSVLGPILCVPVDDLSVDHCHSICAKFARDILQFFT